MNKKRPPPDFLRRLGKPAEPESSSPPPSPPRPRRRAPAVTVEVAPRVNEDGIFGAIRRNKRLKKATEPKRNPRRRMAERVRDFINKNSPESRDVPSPFEGSIYGDDDESEN